MGSLPKNVFPSGDFFSHLSFLINCVLICPLPQMGTGQGLRSAQVQVGCPGRGWDEGSGYIGQMSVLVFNSLLVP